MRKKYLSALLFGALLFADYDDDIEGLRTEVNGIKADIEDLQAQISAGKWIESVTSVEGGFTVTISDGQSFTIVNGKDGQNGQDGAAGAPGAAGADGTKITIGEDGYWYLDGVKSDYKATADEETTKIKSPYVGEDGYWYFYNEEGTAEKSAYKAAGAAYAVEANGGYTLYLPDENGEMIDGGIFLPGAGASITDIELADFDGNGAISDNELNIYKTKFVFNPQTNDIKNASDWDGTKALPANNSVVYSTSQLGLRINPVEIDGTDVEYTLVTSQNNILSNVTLKASEYKELVNSRASYGNGLYTLKMNNVVLSENDAKTLDNAINNYSNKATFAVNADRAVRSDYQVAVSSRTGETLNTIKVNNAENGTASQNALIGSTGVTYYVNTGKTYTIVADNASALYDMYFVVSDEVKSAYNIQFGANNTFTVGRNPDSSSLKAEFKMDVYTAANNGNVNKTTITISLTSAIPSASEYAEITKNVSESNKTFSFDLATMKNGLGNLETWMLNVDLNESEKTFKLYSKYENNKLSEEVSNAISTLFTPKFVDANGNPTTDVNKATDVKVTIDNSKAAATGVVLDKTYYLQVTYKSKDGQVLNTSVVPVKFTAPSLSDLFDIREGYLVGDVINAYFYGTDKDIELARYFRVVPDGVTYNLDEKTTVVTDGGKNYTTKDVLESIDSNNKVATLKSTKKQNSQFELGYGADLIVNATKNNYEGWKYAANSGDNTFTFKITIKSPIVEGTISPIGSSSITVKANDFVNGARITGDQVAGFDYNGNQYSIVPDVATGSATDGVGTTKQGWHKNPQIKTVGLGQDDDKYIDKITAYPAVSTKDGIVNGYFVVQGRSLSNTQNVEVPVTITDAWGYTLTVKVPVTIQVGE